MTVMSKTLSGAPTHNEIVWESIKWKQVKSFVHRLQMRIAKAYREGKHGKVKSLQWILTHSFYAKLLAVKRVTENRGAKTAGVDQVIWRTPKQKMRAAFSLKRRGYRAQPLRRIHIPKKEAGKFRPLSIPTMSCRAQQALHLLSLEPVAETMADKNAYGFRPLRSTADAIERCCSILNKKGCSEYILEGDIKSCFDNISKSWLMNNILMDKQILEKWLNAGYIEKNEYYDTENGTPQGGIISCALLTITLSGLEETIKSVISQRKDKVYLCTYADDFIITGATKEVLREKVMPTVETFLNERGLTLSKEKTKITHINEGFDFLSVNIRKYKGKLLTKPAKSSIKKFLGDIRKTIKSNSCAKTENLIHLLNPKIRGWANYHRHGAAKQTFGYVSHHIFKALWQWAKRRHSRKSAKWIRQKYFRRVKHQNWVFFRKIKDKSGKKSFLDLIEIAKTPIRRHIKFKCEATPYDPAYQEYIAKRIELRKSKQLFRKCKDSWSAWWEIPSAIN